MPIIKTLTIKLLQSGEAVLTMHVDVPTKKDAEHCAKTLKDHTEALINVNNRLCGWEFEAKLTIVIEDYKPK